MEMLLEKRDLMVWIPYEDWLELNRHDGEKGKEEEDQPWDDELDYESESDVESEDENEEDPVQRVRRQLRYDGLMSEEEVKVAKRVLARAESLGGDAAPWAATWEPPLRGMGVTRDLLFHGMDCREGGGGLVVW